MLQPRHSTVTPIERGFRRLRHGDIHYRAAGQGPVVLALHESPRSSLSLLPVIEALRDRYRVIAPDTPGYGLSDPLPGDEPALDDFLDAILALLDSLGVARVALYGAHTGAALAMALAVRNPERVCALVLDGLSAFTDAEAASFRQDYLVPYAPRWDGGHVMGLWSRVKDLYTWFPWHERTPERRLSHEPSGLEPLQRSALGFLQAGEHYTKAYVRAASFKPNTVLRDLAVPTTVIARPDDLIADHLDRLAPGPAWEISWLGPDAGEWAAAMALGLAKGAMPDAMSPRAQPSGDGSVFQPVGSGWLHLCFAGNVDGPLRIVLPGLPGDLKGLLAQQASAHPESRLVGFDLPGCGWSDPLAASGQGLDAVVAALDIALTQQDLRPASLAAEGASAVIAQLWARRRGWALEVETIDPPAWLAVGSALPERPLLRPAAPSWDGAHLTTAWFQLRDLQLYQVPPGAGAPVRWPDNVAPDVARLDRLFRSYVQGPDCAVLLEQVIDHLRGT